MIRVLIVEDSAAVRAVLVSILTEDSSIDVVGTAEDPYEAREKIKALNPDVITLDVEMPRMDGITFLKNLMRLRPMPVVMLSSLTEKDSQVTLDALEIGAVDFIAKPNSREESLNSAADIICARVKAAAGAVVTQFDPEKFQARTDPAMLKRHRIRKDVVVAIGASTGGTEAIKDIICQLPENSAPVVITQHIPASFSSAFARRLDRRCRMEVSEAQDGMKLQAGHVYIAPGDRHLTFESKGDRLFCQLSGDDPVNRHRPSVEKMFDSLLQNHSGRIVAVMLTGMGDDGADAMLRIAKGGHTCLIQDEQSSVVWGMPKAAFELGVSRELTPLRKIGAEILGNMIEFSQ